MSVTIYKGSGVISRNILIFIYTAVRISNLQNELVNIPTITPSVTIYSSHPSLLPTTLGTYLSRIMFDSLMIAF
jgi:hypothetical protein